MYGCMDVWIYEFQDRLRSHRNDGKTGVMGEQNLSDSSQSSTNTDGIKQSEVISLVAHELKNPLVSIRGYAELLLSGAVGELTPQQCNFLRTILSNSDRMSELINDLLDASRLDSGRHKIELSQVDAEQIIQQVVTELLPQLDEKGLLLCTDLGAGIPPIQADTNRLAQIITNLLSNAAKYTLPGGKITISAHADHKDVIFSVQDSGIGIKAEDQERIFQRYFRTDDAQSREIPGTGLGLYISKKLVELQGGRIWFESEFGKGTTFLFSLPK